jgi:CheY-like chemotaxis protein
VRDKKKILLVDDEEAIIVLLKTILNVYGFETIETLSSRQTFDKIANEKPDLIVLDIAMPEMDGYEVCRRLKSRPETRSLPVLMITALSLEQDRKLAIEAGADGFIFKPFDPKNVVSEIKRLLEGA